MQGAKRFRLVVDEGQVYLKCIDAFEDIFEVSKDIVGANLELTDVLEPTLFESHKQIVNALFEVYFDLGTQYVKTQYFESNKIREGASKKIREKYGLEEEESAREMIKSLK